MFAQGALFGDLNDFGLIETLLWTREGGYFLREGHWARLRESAATLGFVVSEQEFHAALAQACAGAEARQLRVRLVLRRDGAIEISIAPFAPEPEGKVWRVGVADTRLDSRDKWLRHKTTRRELYENALARAGDADEVIFLNERDEVCEGARTNVFVAGDGVLLTPPLSSGLLPGVLRADLLAPGKAREKILRLDDLRGGFFLGNSLRGLLAAKLID